MLFPRHIATRGRLDGEYGIATRGLIICPDIVPRFPSDADILDDGSFAVTTEEDLRALLADYPPLTFEGLAEPKLRFTALVDGERLELEATVGDLDLDAVVEAIEEQTVVGVAEEAEPSSSVASDRDIGAVNEEDVEGEAAEEDELVGASDDEPPHC